MEPLNGGSSNSKRRSLVHEEDPNILIFRRINKMIGLVFVLLFISITLLLAAGFTQLRRVNDDLAGIPPLLEFCEVSRTSACLTILNPIITGKSITDPNQIFSLSLETAANDLQHMINSSLIESIDTRKSSSNNCSNSLRDSLGRINESLAAIRVNPFVEFLNDEERYEMKNRIVEAGEDVESCLDDLAEVEQPESVAEMTAKLVVVKVYLNSAVDFVVSQAKSAVTIEIVEDNFYRRILSVNLFVCALQLLFILGLFCLLFRIR